MAKQIKLTHEGTEYTLEFTRKSIEVLERQGFVIQDVEEKPMTILPAFFAGAFLAHHRFVKRELIDEIYKTIPDKQGFLEKLSEMYSEPIDTLMAEPEESEGTHSGRRVFR